MTDWPYPFWIAHRGAGTLAPENTLAAFRLGAQHGYAAFECDIKLSSDDVPFLLHDATLDRTTGTVGVAGERTWAELSQLDAGSWHGRIHAGEPMATLEGVASYILRNRFHLNIEIKPTPGCEERTGRVVAQHAARLWRGAAQPPLLSSFQPSALTAARAAEPALPRALLLDEMPVGWLEQAQALGCVAVVADQALWTADAVERLHGAGLRALAYTVDEEAMARHLAALGLDGLITDAVDRFSPHAGRQF